jgi:hypothetical protein
VTDLEARNGTLLEIVLTAVEGGMVKRKLRLSPKQKTALVVILIREFMVRQEVIDRYLDLAEALVNNTHLEIKA